MSASIIPVSFVQCDTCTTLSKPSGLSCKYLQFVFFLLQNFRSSTISPGKAESTQHSHAPNNPCRCTVSFEMPPSNATSTKQYEIQNNLSVMNAFSMQTIKVYLFQSHDSATVQVTRSPFPLHYVDRLPNLDNLTGAQTTPSGSHDTE